MARIRTIKPEFFRHELLQDLEAQHPGSCVMLTFAALWQHCDKNGAFEWKPRTLKLDILPFLPFDMAETLALLESAKLLELYVVNGKRYGLIPTFSEHQRLSGKELQEPPRHPEKPVTQQGSNGEAPSCTGREGKGREEEGEGNGTRARDKVGECWDVAREAYPAGTYRDVSWMYAERNFRRLCETEDAATLRDAVLAYRTQQQARRAIGTQFVLAPDKFFAGDNWRGPFPLPVSKGEARQAAVLSAAVQWLEESHVAAG